MELILPRLILSVAALAAILAPAWWLAGRLQEERAHPFFRALCAVGYAVVGYVTFVNLVGRVAQQSTVPAALFILASAAAGFFLWRRRPAELAFTPLLDTRREWIGMALVALVAGLPQWLLAVSTPFWDEVAASTIHLTAANHFAEGLFPPRHNAFPAATIHPRRCPVTRL